MHGPRTQAKGETKYPWTEPKACMVLGLKLKRGKPGTNKDTSLGLKPKGKNQVHKIKRISPKQNSGFAKSSDSGFLGNQLLERRNFSA